MQKLGSEVNISGTEVISSFAFLTASCCLIVVHRDLDNVLEELRRAEADASSLRSRLEVLTAERRMAQEVGERELSAARLLSHHDADQAIS